MRNLRLRVASLVLLLATFGDAAAQGFVGVVRINNPYPMPAQVYVQNLDFVGRPTWTPVAGIGPNAFINLPAVPPGKLFGVKLANGREFPPFQAWFSNPYQALYVYTIPP